MRFHLNKCKSGRTCRFAHQCPIPKSNGEPCGGPHTATKHKAAPHWPVQPLADNSEPSQALQGLANFWEHPPQVVEVSRSPPKRYPIAIQFSTMASVSAKFFLDIFAGATMPVTTALTYLSCDRIQPTWYMTMTYSMMRSFIWSDWSCFSGTILQQTQQSHFESTWPCSSAYARGH